MEGRCQGDSWMSEIEDAVDGNIVLVFGSCERGVLEDKGG